MATGLRAGGPGVRSLVLAQDLSLLQNVQTGSGTLNQPPIQGLVPGGKAAGA
jgi:hypothetical protein